MTAGTRNILLILTAALAAYGWKYKEQAATMETLKLRYFTPAEFGVSLPFLDPALLVGLDNLRAALGHSVAISPAAGSLYRPGDLTSQHGKGKAADIMLPAGSDLARAFAIAQTIPEFGGVGVYPYWKPTPGLHVDTRPRVAGKLATWGDIGTGGRHEYVSAAATLARAGLA
jgi:hypothetical protein